MILVAIIFMILGILIKYGKMYFLIAGYNTMSAKEKATYNVAEIAIIFRNVMFGMALIIIIGLFIAQWLENPQIEIISMFIALGVGLPYLLIKSNSAKYKVK